MIYDIEPDLNDENSPLFHALELVGANKRVLEVGCATGYFSAALTGRGCRVVGLEIDPEAAALAKEHCEDVVIGDVETMDLETTFDGPRFDVVLFGDVLEHLRDPLAALRRTRPLLAPGGYVVASIPNVAHAAVRLSLMLGRFDYQDRGLLDQTHTRLFTRSSLEQLFFDAGFDLVEMRRVVAGPFDTEIPLQREEVGDDLVQAVDADVEARTYQFVIKAVLHDADDAVRVLYEREEQQRAALVHAHEQVRDVTRDIERLQGELAAARAERDSLLAHRERFNARPAVRLYHGLARRLRRH